jgi:energy-coupling factor transport system substrate-specific component
MYRTGAKDGLDPTGAAILMSGYFVAPGVFTGIALLVAAALARTGAARGLRADRPIPSRTA